MSIKMNFSLDKDVMRIPATVMVVGGIGSCRNAYGKDLVQFSTKPAAWISAADKYLDIRHKEDLPHVVNQRLRELRNFAMENEAIAVFSWQVEIIPDEDGNIKLENLKLGHGTEIIDYILWPQRIEKGYQIKVLKQMKEE